jgi:hypothetical protein
MRCARCNKILREVYYVNGKPYGIECAKIRGYSSKKLAIKNTLTENPYQGDLFFQKTFFEKWREGLEW